MDWHTNRVSALDPMGAAPSGHETEIDREDHDAGLVRLARWPGGIGEEPVFGEPA